MSNRLPELLRQRALLQEHLAWLDREIMNESGALPTPPPASPAAPVPPPLPTPALASTIQAPPIATKPPTAPTEAAADEILHRYEQNPQNLTQDTRKGCLILFIAGLGLIVLLAFLGYALYARHIGRWW